MDMDRRAFLKTLGLGAVTLTVPRPLSVIAAKMADLEKPPLHVGYAELTPAAHCGDKGYYLFYDLGIMVERGITASRHRDYIENWGVSLFMRKKGDPGKGVQYLRARAAHIPDPSNMVTRTDEDGNQFQVPDFLCSRKAYVLKPDDVLEFWFVPHSAMSATEPPNYPLPGLMVFLRGVIYYGANQPGRSTIHWQYDNVKKVLLDRAKAIELGLVSPTVGEFDLG